MVSQENILAALLRHQIGQFGIGIEQLTGWVNDGLGAYAAGFIGEGGQDFLSGTEGREFQERLGKARSLIVAMKTFAERTDGVAIFESLDAATIAADRFLTPPARAAARRIMDAIDAALAKVAPEDLAVIAAAEVGGPPAAGSGRPTEGLGTVRIAVRISLYALCHGLGIAERGLLHFEYNRVRAPGKEDWIRVPTTPVVAKLATAILDAMRVEAEPTSIKSEVNAYRRTRLIDSAMVGQTDWLSPGRADFLTSNHNWNDGPPEQA